MGAGLVVEIVFGLFSVAIAGWMLLGSLDHW
jgi:hypothetical protein